LVTFLGKDVGLAIKANIMLYNCSFNRIYRREIRLIVIFDKKLNQVSKIMFLRHIDEMGY